jgi:hypothetical protein
LIIPLYVFAAWGIYTWLFWIGLYFLIVRALASRFRNRFVVYHCQRELVLPAFFTFARQVDPKADWGGHVLSLHGLGLQWSVTSDRYGGHLLFVPTNPYLVNPHQKMLEEQLTNLCRTLIMPKKNIRWLWATLTFGLLCLMIGVFVWDFSAIVHLFRDYWLPH